MRLIYMDNAATTKPLKEAVKAMTPYLEKSYGNPSSLHALGLEADRAVREAREKIAKTINAEADEIVFTSGATEANNLAIFGVAREGKGKKQFITTRIEHSASKNPMRELAKQGNKVTFLEVDREGFADLKQLKGELKKSTALVSVIHANNEIGTIQDIEAIGKLCKAKGALLHVDAAQSYTKVPIDVKKMGIDLLTLNSHKIHGPKGAGCLYIKKGVKLRPLLFGGPQEMHLRAGTENVPAIAGFAVAAEIGCGEMAKNTAKMAGMRDALIKGLLEIEDTTLNGPRGTKRLCNNVDATFHYIEGEAILMRLMFEGVMVSSGSACSSESLEPSHVLTAIGLKHEQAHGSIRFSLSKFNSMDEIDYVVRKTKKVVRELREITSFKKPRGPTRKKN